MRRSCRRSKRALQLPSTVAVLCALAGPAAYAAPQGHAPKRLCKPRIEWSSIGQTRAEAQRKAIDGWSGAAAGQYGDTFTKWSIAGIARVSCSLTLEGHRCRAAASPCRDLNEDGAAPKR